MRNANKRSIGTRYEQLAETHLQEMGYQILEQNYRCKRGEIDLVAKDGEYLIFCEVKYRSALTAGHPLEAVDARKQRKILQAARMYLLEHGLEEVPVRFDVVGICSDEVIVIQNAFEDI